MAGVSESDAGTLEGEASAEEREAALRDVIQTIARSKFDLDAVLQTVIDQAVRLCRANNGNIARRVGEKDEYRVAARYLIGADGGKSLVRKRSGIGFPGFTAADRVSRAAHVEIPGLVRLPTGGYILPG